MHHEQNSHGIPPPPPPPEFNRLTDRQTLLKTLPSRTLRMRAVKINLSCIVLNYTDLITEKLASDFTTFHAWQDCSKFDILTF